MYNFKWGANNSLENLPGEMAREKISREKNCLGKMTEKKGTENMLRGKNCLGKIIREKSGSEKIAGKKEPDPLCVCILCSVLYSEYYVYCVMIILA